MFFLGGLIILIGGGVAAYGWNMNDSLNPPVTALAIVIFLVGLFISGKALIRNDGDWIKPKDRR